MEDINDDGFDFGSAYYQYEDAKRKDAIKELIKRNSLTDEFYELSLARRWFCFIKTLICLLLKRTAGSYTCEYTLCIIAWNETSSVGEYSGYAWDACWTDYRIFKGWQVLVASDSSY